MLDYGLDMSEVDRDLAIPDLIAEGEDLDALVSAEPDWTKPTPAVGWTIAHQIAHLAIAEANVLTAIRTPDAFDTVLKQQAAAGPRWADLDAAAGAAQPRSVLLGQWRTARTEVAAALRELPLTQPIPWFGSDVTPALMVPLRLMETWAHGQDIYDTLGVPHPPTSRLRHIATLGVIGLGISFYALQLPIPTGPFRVELTAPNGDTWTWGPLDAPQRVQGPALDFCLRVTQRKPLPETTLTAVGPEAQTWLENARVFL
ncbi:TIGR03084 family metal-binding protein [Nocardia concava]|uniref:TIGR03084 family metal-binding protein n=1 Tax=Nocardia concava TaxID=257281 RepID=UPI0002F93982|nr:TIGR03084 family metal-binding protein [Nocardia concava]